jgi:hypothetical protein
VANIKSFSDWNGETVELGYGYIPMSNADFARLFPGVKGVRCDGFTMYAGTVNAHGKGGSKDRYTGEWTVGAGGIYPVTRRIEYKSRPSLHECNAKCLGGKHNGTCECRCGGKNHGAGSFSCAKV